MNRLTEIEAKIHPMDEAKIDLYTKTHNGEVKDLIQKLKEIIAYYYTCWVDEKSNVKDIVGLTLDVIEERWKKSKHSTFHYFIKEGETLENPFPLIMVWIDYSDDNFVFSGIYQLERNCRFIEIENYE